MPRLSKILIISGSLFIFVSLVICVWSFVTADIAKDRADDIVHDIESLLPERVSGVMEDYSDMNMPALELDGEDFIAVVEVPSL